MWKHQKFAVKINPYQYDEDKEALIKEQILSEIGVMINGIEDMIDKVDIEHQVEVRRCEHDLVTKEVYLYFNVNIRWFYDEPLNYTLPTG